jgi:hypothetical protein
VTTRAPSTPVGFIEDPDSVAFAIVGTIEPRLDRADVHAAFGQAAPSRAQRRRLAHALAEAPDLLTSGRPAGPPQIERFIRALLQRGARRVVQPRCGHCHQPKPLPQRDGAIRICGTCDALRRAQAEPCVGCGSTRQIASRDRDGQPRCARCLSYQDHDPVDELRAVITALDPGLDRHILAEIIQTAIPQQFQRHQVLWELQARPDLLTGQGAHGSPRLNALIHALTAAGIRGVVAPACPTCGRTARLSHQRDGLRCCRRCYDQTGLQTCSRCHQRKPVSSRTASGEPVCNICFRRDPANHGRCITCGRIGSIGRHADGDVWCRRCYRAPLATCTLCGQHKPCHLASTNKPRCENCSRHLRHCPCSRCGNSRAVWTRTAQGQPLCGSCARRREPCAVCANIRTVAARLPTGPVCSTCYRKHPASFLPCTRCGITERLHRHGLCKRCACQQQLLTLLSHTDGDLRPHVEPVYQVLANSEPSRVLSWLETSTARKILAELGQAGQPLTHDTLDRYLPSRAIHHLRKVLVAGDVLPQRDEYLAMLEQWVKTVVGEVVDPGERRIVRSFAVWHHLRRLRQQSERHRVTPEQAAYVQADVRIAMNLITWLRAHDQSLASCSQRDIDQWLTEGAGTHYKARTFLLWTDQRGHTHDLLIPVPARSEHLARIEDDRRWHLVRRLLHDENLSIEDRVAGILLLLYAQPLARIARITRDQIIQRPACVQLLLGTKPLDLPPPIGDLVRELAARRHGHAVLGRTDDHPWLFSGGAPGQPITGRHLRLRLRPLGIPARTSRNTALIDLATQVPAVVLSRLLGIHINTATTWVQHAGTSGAAYAAEVSRRTSTRQT